jgi:L-lactate dehydrogenase complex protein LldG
MSDAARREVLARVRAALGDVAPAEPHAWTEPLPQGLQLDGEARVARFVERVADFGATVVRSGDAAAAIAAACARHADAAPLLVPAGLPPAWLPAGVELLHDAGLERDAIEAAGGVLTTCAAAIAETGSIVLDGGAGQGRRLLTLLPDLHVCVVPVQRIVADVPAGLAAVEPTRPLTLISGPSATSDIELERVEGVHGPRRLEVIVLG